MDKPKNKLPGQSRDHTAIQLVATLGCALLTLAMGMTVFGGFWQGAHDPASGRALVALAGPGAFLAGFAAAHLVSYLNPEPIAFDLSGRRLAALSAALMLVGLGAGSARLIGPSGESNALGLAELAFSEAAFGAFAGILMPAWGRIWSISNHGGDGAVRVARNTAIGVLVAIPLALLIAFTPPEIEALGTAAAYAGSFMLYLFCTQSLLPGETAALAEAPDPSSSVPSVRRPRLVTRAAFTSAAMGLLFGVAFCYGNLSLTPPQPLYCIALAAMAACAAALALTLRRAIPRVPELEHLTFLGCGVGLMLIGLLPFELRFIPLTATLAFLLMYYIFNPNTLAAVTLLDNRFSSYHCARENVVSLVGTLVGWCALAALIALGLDLKPAFLVLSIACIAAMLAEPLFTPYISQRLIDQLIEADEAPSVEADTASDKPSSVRWKERCVELCRTCELSPRESEVLMLLARGRNASAIAEKLVISPHTARTHIGRIYQKVGVNSHQELLDKVDGIEAEGASETARS